MGYHSEPLQSNYTKQEHNSNYFFIGLSGHLVKNAHGHFETFHKGLLAGFRAVLGAREAIFLGSESEPDDDTWFVRALPTSMTSTVPWLSSKYLDSMQSLRPDSRSKVVFYLYEGNLATLHFMSKLIRRSTNSYLYMNFFKSQKYQQIMRSRTRYFFFSLMLRVILRDIETKVVLTADTHRLSRLISQKTRTDVGAFPMYSAIPSIYRSLIPGSKILINIRGKKAEELVEALLGSECRVRTQQFVLHGVSDDFLRNSRIDGLPRVLVSHFKDEEAYFTSLASYQKIVFLYDPNEFSMQSSGRLFDAIVTGVHYAVPSGTALEEVLLQYGSGSSFNFGSLKDLSDALDFSPKISRTNVEDPTADWAALQILASIKERSDFAKASQQWIIFNGISFLLDFAIDGVLFIARIVAGFLRRSRNLRPK